MYCPNLNSIPQGALFRVAKVVRVAGFLLLTWFAPPNLRAETPQRFGLWVEAEGVNQPFRSSADFATFLSFSKYKGFTDLYCQVYRQGRSWFPSMMADDTPFREAAAQGINPLAVTIRHAHARGQRVHAWINALRISGDPQLPLLQVVGRDAVLVDSYGNSMLDYDSEGNAPGSLAAWFMLETPGVWLDPGSARVRQYIVETVRDVISAHPDLDGIHLDMIRMPFSLRKVGSKNAASRPDFGYGRNTVERFYEYSGAKAPPLSRDIITKLENSEAWAAWQRAQVTLLVFEVRELLNRLAPDMELSAAVIASRDRSFSEANQDWARWLKGGIVDVVLPMSYSRDSAVVAEQARDAVRVAGGKPVIVGLGAWLMSKEPALLSAQGKSALKSGARGVTLFSYSNLVSSGGLPLVDQFYSSVFLGAK